MFNEYKRIHLPEWYFETVSFHSTAGILNDALPCILGVDTVAIEPCLEQSKRLLLLNQVGANIDIEQLEAPGEQTETSHYRLVYQLMPLDPTLPNIVASVILHTNRKANDLGNDHLRFLKSICVEAGFWVCPFSGDGDNADREFIKPFFAITKSEHG
jgi:hypothetical protein